MRVDAPVVADFQRGRVNEGDATALTLPSLQVAAQGDERRWHQLDEAMIADHARKLSGVMFHHLFSVVSLEVTVCGSMKQHDDRHHLRQTQVRGAVSLTVTRTEQSPLPEWFKELTEIVYVTENR